MNKLGPNLPLGYLAKTRFSGSRAAVGFFACEAVPLLIVMHLYHDVPLWEFLLVFCAHFGLYESGYVFNDREAAREPGDDRPRIGSVGPAFYTIRACLLTAASYAIYTSIGPRPAFLFITSSLAVLALLLLHSATIVRATPPRRLTTFTALAFYKYAPIVIPFTSITHASTILLAIFGLHGSTRVATYAVRKFQTQPESPRRPPKIPETAIAVAVGAPITMFSGPDIRCLAICYMAVLTFLATGRSLRASHTLPVSGPYRADPTR